MKGVVLGALACTSAISKLGFGSDWPNAAPAKAAKALIATNVRIPQLSILRIVNHFHGRFWVGWRRVPDRHHFFMSPKRNGPACGPGRWPNNAIVGAVHL
jgi:hypothetical protein